MNESSSPDKLSVTRIVIAVLAVVAMFMGSAAMAIIMLGLLSASYITKFFNVSYSQMGTPKEYVPGMEYIDDDDTDPDKLVTFATFGNKFEADILKSELNNNGIQCIVLDENSAKIWFHTPVCGDITLKLRKKDVPQAHRVMQEVISNTELEDMVMADTMEDPGDYNLLQIADTPHNADSLKNLLESYGIMVRIDKDVRLISMLFGIYPPGSIQVKVHECNLARAREIIEKTAPQDEQDQE